MQTSLTNSGVVLSNTVPIQQNCGNTTGVTPYIPGPNVPIVDVAPPNPQPGAGARLGLFIQHNILLMFIFLLVIFAALIAGVYFAINDTNE